MTSSQPDRLDRIEALLERSIVESAKRNAESDERMTRIEQRLDESARRSEEWSNQFQQRLDESAQQAATDKKESNERLTRIEQAVESNNRFLSAFTQDMRRYIETLENLALRLDGVIASSNQDRTETNTRLGFIQRQVTAIARHLGVR